MVAPQVLTLIENGSCLISPSILPLERGQALWRHYDLGSHQLHLEFPNPATNGQWRLSGRGWVGTIPITEKLQLSILPKVPLRNVCAMWARLYAWEFSDLPEALFQSRSVLGFYQQLVQVLALRVRRRVAHGIYRAYVPQEQLLPYVRGRLRWQKLAAADKLSFPCRYDQFLSDVTDNQVLLFTLTQILRSGRCDAEVTEGVTRAIHGLQGLVSYRHVTVEECVDRPYGRLNEDYRSLHALCRFFLEHSGPTHEAGDRQMVPFLVHMGRLFERFVAAWLQANLPPLWRLQVQEHVAVGSGPDLQFAIDLVIYDRQGQAKMVMDTKYKVPERMATQDFSQVVTYAKAKGCRQAILIYPGPLTQPIDVRLEELHIRSLTFSLDDDLDSAGRRFLDMMQL